MGAISRSSSSLAARLDLDSEVERFLIIWLHLLKSEAQTSKSVDASSSLAKASYRQKLGSASLLYLSVTVDIVEIESWSQVAPCKHFHFGCDSPANIVQKSTDLFSMICSRTGRAG